MQSISKKLINKIKDHLSDDPTILLLTHINPDGDAIGSLLGLYHYFVLNGFKTFAVTPNDFPDFLKWLPGSDKIMRYSMDGNEIKELLAESDIIFNLDFNEPQRLGDMGNAMLQSNAIKILIDHHPDPDSFNKIEISDTSVSSTAELIYYLLDGMGNDPFLTPEIAECLFTGIMTDTGCFSFNSSLGKTYLVTAELLNTGIDKDRIYDKVYNNFSEDRMRLAGFAMNEKMNVLSEYHTAYIALTRKELRRFNYILGDTEGFVNLPLSVKGIRFSVLFLEKKDHVKISFRSKGNFAANKFAEKHFHGGGHHNAAGGESFKGLIDTVNEFESLLHDYKDQLAGV